MHMQEAKPEMINTPGPTNQHVEQGKQKESLRLSCNSELGSCNWSRKSPRNLIVRDHSAVGSWSGQKTRCQRRLDENGRRFCNKTSIHCEAEFWNGVYTYNIFELEVWTKFERNTKTPSWRRRRMLRGKAAATDYVTITICFPKHFLSFCFFKLSLIIIFLLANFAF